MEACRSPGEVEAWLARRDLAILASEETSKGKQRARILTLLVPSDGIIFRAKWRAWWTNTPHNRPRRELAAHHVQRLFLLPHEYVVPPATGHCFPLETYRKHVEPKAQPTFPGTRCVYGILSYWLEDAIGTRDAMKQGLLHALIDEKLFERNEIYRRSIASVNLLAYLISHGDSHKQQFVFTGGRDLYANIVDNSISFSDYRNPLVTGRDDLSVLHVPAVPAEAIERLRHSDVRKLAVLEQYRVDSGGILMRTRPTAIMSNPERGVRRHEDELQVGLTTNELAEVQRRIVVLTTRAAAGELKLF